MRKARKDLRKGDRFIFARKIDLSPLRSLVLLAALGCCGPASAADVQEVLALWGAQSGPWNGHIDIYGPGGEKPRTVGLQTKWEAVPGDGSRPVAVTKIETFIGPDSRMSSITLMFSGSEPGTIDTPYFANGKQENFRFKVVSVSVVDATHWKTVIASPGASEVYEGRPAVLRYVRTRSGDTVENTKEVNFLDDGGDEKFELRSFIRQTRVAEDRNGARRATSDRVRAP
jgi:hypothetical protein